MNSGLPGLNSGESQKDSPKVRKPKEQIYLSDFGLWDIWDIFGLIVYSFGLISVLDFGLFNLCPNWAYSPSKWTRLLSVWSRLVFGTFLGHSPRKNTMNCF